MIILNEKKLSMHNKKCLFLHDSLRKGGDKYGFLVSGKIIPNKLYQFKNAKESLENIVFSSKVVLANHSLFYDEDDGNCYLTKNLLDTNGVVGDLVYVSDPVALCVKNYYHNLGMLCKDIMLQLTNKEPFLVTIFVSKHRLEDFMILPEMRKVENGDYIKDIVYEENIKALEAVDSLLRAH